MTAFLPKGHKMNMKEQNCQQTDGTTCVNSIVISNIINFYTNDNIQIWKKNVYFYFNIH